MLRTMTHPNDDHDGEALGLELLAWLAQHPDVHRNGTEVNMRRMLVALSVALREVTRLECYVHPNPPRVAFQLNGVQLTALIADRRSALHAAGSEEAQ